MGKGCEKVYLIGAGWCGSIPVEYLFEKGRLQEAVEKRTIALLDDIRMQADMFARGVEIFNTLTRAGVTVSNYPDTTANVSKGVELNSKEKTEDIQ